MAGGEGLDMALVLLVIAVILVLIWIALGYGAGGGTWRVNQLRVTAPENQLVLGCNTGIINNVTTTGTVTYNLPDPEIARCNFILSESSTGVQDIHSALQLYGNLILANDAARSVLHGTTASQTGTHNLLIHGSDSAGPATGGSITIHAGDSESGVGGDINLVPGNGGKITFDGSPIVIDGDIEFSTTQDHYIKFESTGATTRALFVQGLDTTGAATGGTLSLSAGSSTVAGAGGDLALLAGKGGPAAGGAGGDVTIAGGDAQTATKTGGSVSIQAGKAGAGGSNGSIEIGTSSGSAPTGITLGNSASGNTLIEAANDTSTSANVLVSGNIGPSLGLLTSDDTGYLRLRATLSETFIESGLKATTDSQAPLRFKPILGSANWWSMNNSGKGNLVGEDTTSPANLADTKAAFYTKGGAVVSEKLFVGKNAQVEGSLVATPDANLIITGNAGPTVSLLSTVGGNLRLAASNASAANFIESGATSAAASTRELRFTGIAGSPLWWTMNLNSNGNLAGESNKTPTTSVDTANASFYTKGGGIVEKDWFVNGGLYLANGATAFSWFEEYDHTTKATFQTGGKQTPVAGVIKVSRTGRQVTLYGSNLLATNAGSPNTGVLKTDTALPSKFFPVFPAQQPAYVTLNGNHPKNAGLVQVDTAGFIYVSMELDGTGFTSQAGDNGIPEGWTVVYTVS